MAGAGAGDEDETILLVTARRQRVGLLPEQHRGRLVDFVGDDFLAEFASAMEPVARLPRPHSGIDPYLTNATKSRGITPAVTPARVGDPDRRRPITEPKEEPS